MIPFIFDIEHPLLQAANDAFDREFIHSDALSDEDVRKAGAEVSDAR
jgi:hypothetical protein